MKRNSFIKVLTLCVILCTFFTQNIYATDVQKFLCDGNIELSGVADDSERDSHLGVIITKQDMDWLDETVWKEPQNNQIVFADDIETDFDGKYKFNIFLEEMGTYNVTVGTGQYKIVFTDAKANADTLERMNTAASGEEVYSILKTSKAVQALILDDEIFLKLYEESDDVLQKLSEIIYEEIKKNKITDADECTEMVYKACAAVMLNGDSKYVIDNIDSYITYMHLDKINLDKYYNKSCAKYITTLIKNEKINSLSNMNHRLFEAILLANIRYNDSISNLKSMLEDYADELETKASKVTDSLVRSMVGKTYTLDQVKSYINSYTEPTSDRGNGGGSSGTVTDRKTTSGVIPPKIETASPITGEIIPNEEVGRFEDLDTVPWAEQFIKKLALKGIIEGRTSRCFCPNESITREEFVKLLVSVFSINVIGEDMRFDDVTSDDWYYPYVKCAYNAGIITGISASEFGAGQPITRQDMAVMTARAAYIAGLELTNVYEEKEFADEEMFSDYAVEDIHALQRAGIMKGDDTESFAPNANSTRAEAAVVISAIYDLL